MVKSGCGLNEDVVLEHTKLLELLVMEKDNIKQDVQDIKQKLDEVHRILCVSNGKRSVTDATSQNTKDIEEIKKELETAVERRRQDAKFRIEQLIALLAILISVFALIKGHL